MTKYKAMYSLVGKAYKGIRCRDCADSAIELGGVRRCGKLQLGDNIVLDDATCAFARDKQPTVD
jgi:hypothetical protein